MLFCHIYIDSFAHGRIRQIGKYFPKYLLGSILTACFAVVIKCLGKYLTICLMLSCAKEAIYMRQNSIFILEGASYKRLSIAISRRNRYWQTFVNSEYALKSLLTTFVNSEYALKSLLTNVYLKFCFRCNFIICTCDSSRQFNIAFMSSRYYRSHTSRRTGKLEKMRDRKHTIPCSIYTPSTTPRPTPPPRPKQAISIQTIKSIVAISHVYDRNNCHRCWK